MKRLLYLILALTLLLSLTACGEDNPEELTPEPSASATVSTATPSPSPTPKPTETPPEETPEKSEIMENPLNGLALEEPYAARPFAVMLNNLDVALPHCGVAAADIIYEVLVEGGITRMDALYTDMQSAGKIGPIRSIRPYYLDIDLAYGAVIGHAGGSEEAYSRIANEHLENVDGVRGSYADGVFYRDPERMPRGSEHALFSTGENLYNCAASLGYPLTVEDYDSGLTFTEDGTPEDGEPAETIAIRFSNYKSTTLTYDEDTGTYSAVQFGQDYIDGNTGEKVTFRNVLAIFADTRQIDDYGRLSVTLNGTGSGYYACGGEYVPINWSRSGTSGRFVYTLENGTEVTLGVGKTYIAVLNPNQSNITFAET